MDYGVIAGVLVIGAIGLLYMLLRKARMVISPVKGNVKVEMKCERRRRGNQFISISELLMSRCFMNSAYRSAK